MQIFLLAMNSCFTVNTSPHVFRNDLTCLENGQWLITTVMVYISVYLLYHHGFRIIIIIQMSLVEVGSLVGGVIGSPASLDIKKLMVEPRPAATVDHHSSLQQWVGLVLHLVWTEQVTTHQVWCYHSEQ